MHIAVHCITDAKSAAAVARALGVSSLTVPRKIYTRIVWELLKIEPAYYCFHIHKHTGRIVSSGQLARLVTQDDVVTIFPESE